jgi:hypothetical protein
LERREEARELLQRAYTLYPTQAVVVLAYAQFVDSVDGASCASALLYQRAYTLNPLDANAAAGLALHLHHFSTGVLTYAGVCGRMLTYADVC